MQPVRIDPQGPDSHLPVTHPEEDRSNVIAGSVWMVVISLALFFLPAINGFVGGLVGGYKVGSVGRALVAAIIPALLVAGGMWILLAMFDLPVLGFFAGIGVAILVVLAGMSMFLGALVGGLLSNFKRMR